MLFELWCWRRLLKVPWTVRRSNQSILKEISPEYSLEGLILKLKLQCFGHLMQRTNSLEKTLMLGKIEGRGRRGQTEDEMVGWHHWFDGHEFEQALGVGDGQRSWHPAVHGASKCWIWLSNWTDCNLNYIMHNGQNNVYLSLLLWWLNELDYGYKLISTLLAPRRYKKGWLLFVTEIC